MKVFTKIIKFLFPKVHADALEAQEIISEIVLEKEI